VSRETREARCAQLRISPILALALFAFSPVKAPALEPVRAGQEGSIVRAVFVDKTLWTLSDAGEIFRVTEADHELIKVPTVDPALDLWIRDGVPAIVTSPRSDEAPLTIRRWTGEEFRALVGISTKQERFLGVSSNGEPATILTTRRTMDVVGNTIRPRDVDWPRSRPILGVTSILARKDDVLLGINSGEWGGGLARVDRRTGRVSYIESRTGELCGGALNGDCDPVNGIVPAPWNKDCVVIAVGLVHFLARGRIDEVCGDRVRELYSKAYPVKGLPPPATRGDKPAATVAFFGLVSVDGKVLAVGLDGLYRLSEDGAALLTPLPKFENVGDIRVSFALPDVVLLLTEANERHSISGSVPMLVPRN
jgi:hypothetical protein